MRELRKKRDNIEKLVADGQKLIMPGCYSRKLWKYNKYLNEQIEANGDYDFEEKDKTIFEKKIYLELLEKIKRIEGVLHVDIDSLSKAERIQAAR